MKRAIAIISIMALMISCLALTACGGGSDEPKDQSGSKYIGTWEATKIEFKDKSAEAGDEEFEEGMIFVLNEDGTAQLASGEEEEPSTWEETDDGIIIQKMEFTDQDGKLVMDFMGVKMTLERVEK